MNIRVRLGTEQDINAVAQLYDDVTDYLARTINYPGWHKGIYPTRNEAVEGVGGGHLFVATDNDEVVGSIILIPKPEPAYLPVKWQIEVDYSRVLVVHTFAVSPQKLKHGVGRSMLQFADQYAKEVDALALRLDVHEKNLPAIALYERCGYSYVDTVSLGMESSGLYWFKLYEKLV